MRSLLGKFWIACAGSIILLAVLLSIVRVLLPHADVYRHDVERGLTGLVGQEVSVGLLAAEWRGLGPRLVLSDVRVQGGEGAESRFERAELEVDILRSVFRGTLYVRRLVVAGLRLTVERGADGAIEVAGLPAASGAQDPLSAIQLPPWLLAQGRLAVEDAEIVWIDRRDPADERRYRFTGVDLDLWSAGSRHQLDGRLTPPVDLGERLRVVLDLVTPDDGRWRATLYVEGEGLRPAEWLAGRTLGGLRVGAGETEGSAWLEWRDGRLQRLDGRLSTAGLAIEPAGTQAGAPAGFVIDTVSGLFAWRSLGPGWRLDVAQLVLGHGDERDEPRRLAVGSSTGAAGEIMARMDALDVDDGVRLVALSPHAPEFLAGAVGGLRPRGLLRDIELSLRPEGEAPRFQLRARFEDVGGDPWEGVPGLAGIGGTLYMDERSGMLDMHAGESAPTFDGLFREALPAARLNAHMSWERSGAGWRLRSPGLSFANEDLALEAWGRLDWPADGGRPTVALFASFEAASIARISRYLPAGIMSGGTVRWLDRAILGGRIPRGELILHGPLRDFPFDGGEGLFRVDFDLRGGLLEYAEAWPRIEEIDAGVTFEGRRMRIDASGARTLSARIGATRVAIDDLKGKPAVLTVEGEAQGSTADALSFLRDTPLAARFGAYAEDLAAAGTSRLALALELPLGSPPEVRGTLTFEDSTLLLARGGVEVTHIDGPLHFSGEGLEATDLTAHVLGLPATVQVYSSGAGAERRTRIEAQGVADAGQVAGLLQLPPDWLAGTAAWHAQLLVPNADELRSEGMMLRIDSALEGLEIALPEPLAKPAAGARPLTVMMRLPRAPGRPVWVSLGSGLSLALGFGDDRAVERGELRLGGGTALLPEGPGLHIVGRTGRFSYSEWRRVLGAEGARRTGEGAASPVPRFIDLEVDEAELFGRTFHEALIVARAGALAWEASVRSREMVGRMEIPLHAGPPWRVQLEYLHLAAPQQDDGREGGQAVDPLSLPAVRLTSERFTYGGADLGRLSLSASPQPAGMRLDQLSLTSPALRVNARGDWVRVGDEQYSSFNIEFNTEDFGRALARFGYADSFKGGKGQSTITARWHGPPTAFALDRLHGTMDITITNGRLLEVEPGAGRVFGLISLQALPRRLTLDFSDFFGKGFGFDRIAGTFAVRDGVATTTDLTMVGPAARVEARGDIDLAGRQYDQTVVVVPSVGSGLPIAGAVAGGVPIGAAMLLVERMFKDNIERMTRQHYHIRGPWHDPVVERLQDGVQSGKR